MLAIAALTICASSEFAVRWWLTTHPAETMADYLKVHIDAYAHANYYGPEFIAEQNAFRKGLSIDDEGVYHWADFQGRWFNIANNIRITTNQPPTALHTVYIFGNSTLLSIEVPDNMTIPSQLQVLVGGRYKVVNRGVAAANSLKELDYLEQTKLNRGDVVVFYDGILDAMDIYTVARNRRNNAPPDTLCGWLNRNYQQMAVIQLLCAYDQYSAPAAISDPALLDAQISSAYTSYARHIATAKQYVQQHGAAFYHFLEPHIWTAPLSDYETTLMRLELSQWPGTDTLVRRAWQSFRRIPGTIDLSQSLNALRANGIEIYIDDHHMTERGNAAIARAVYDAIWQTF